MKIKIKISTPKGQAKGTEGKIKPFIINPLRRKIKVISSSNEEDNEIIWDIEAPPKDIFRIVKNVSRFEVILKSVFSNSLVKKVIKSKLDDNQQAELKDMLENHTKIEIIKGD